MKKIFGLILVSAAFIVGCNNSTDPESKSSTEELSSKITELEPKLVNDTTFVMDYQVAKELIPLYVKYAHAHPDDEKSPNYLIKAAETSQGLGQGNAAIKYYEELLTQYPKHPRASGILFQVAFVYETVLGNKEMAIKKYEEFIDKYPDHELAKDAQKSIVDIDKSPEELIEEFKAKNQDNS